MVMQSNTVSRSGKRSKPALGKRSISFTEECPQAQSICKKVAIENKKFAMNASCFPPEKPEAKIKINWDTPLYIETSGNEKKFYLVKQPDRPFYPLSVFKYLLTNNYAAIASAMKTLAIRQTLPPKIKESYFGKLDALFEKHSSKRDTLPSSPKTPVFARQYSVVSIDSGSEKQPSISCLHTPTSGEDERRMEEEIEEIVKRTPILQQPSKTVDSIQKAASLLKSMNYLDLCHYSPTKTKSKKQPSEIDEKKGSSLFYALVTPRKKMQDLIGSNSAVSPVRRSLRIMEKMGSSPKCSNLFENLTDIPDLPQRGFLPNPAFSNSPLKKTKEPPKDD